MADDHSPHDSVPNDPAHTASRQAAERARHGELAPARPGTKAEEIIPAGTALGGAAAGAAAGTVTAGPIGTIIGAVAGALGGWWAGLGATDTTRHYTPNDEARYRSHHESGAAGAPADIPFDRARAGYQLGHLARANPEYRGRRFEEVEPELRHGWSPELAQHYGEWTGMRGYARTAFESSGDAAQLEGAGPADRAESLQDPLPPGDDRRS